MYEIAISFTLPNAGVIIPENQVSQYTISTSMGSILPVAEFVMLSLSSDITKHVKRGAAVNITFTNNETGDIIAVLPMSVLTTDNLTNTGLGAGNLIKVSLVHRLFFKNKIKNRAWGTTSSNIGTIFQDVINEDFSDYTSKSYISTTQDHSNIRYQLEENSLEFLERIQKYGIIDGLPVYCYIDAKDNFYLKGIAECYRESTENVVEIIPAADMSLITHKQQNIEGNLERVLADDYRLYEDSSKSKLATRVNFSNVNFKSTNQTGILSYKIFDSFEVSTTNVAGHSNVNIIHKDWNLNPSDALAIASKEVFENNINSTSAVIDLDRVFLDKFLIGQVVKLTLIGEAYTNSSSDEVTTENTNTGYYLIWQSLFNLSEEGHVSQILHLTRIR